MHLWQSNGHPLSREARAQKHRSFSKVPGAMVRQSLLRLPAPPSLF